MHHTSILYIRRLMVGIIVLVFLLVLGNYLYTRYRRNPAETQDLQILDSEMVQSVESFEYSDTRHGLLRFKIRARSLLEERPGRNYFEGIEAFDFNPDGSVRNEIHSRFAEYDRENGTVDFIEDVRLILGRDIELRTRTLHYDLNADIGTTKDPVQFYSENINGKARGLRYRLNRKLLELEHDVDFLISPDNESGGETAAVEAMHAVSDRAVCLEDRGRITFQGNARLQSDSLLITGDTIQANVDKSRNELDALSCIGNASYRSGDNGESRVLGGDRMFFDIQPGSRNLTAIHVSGHAEFHSESLTYERRLKGDEITLHFDPLQDALTSIESTTDVELRMQHNTEVTLITGGRLDAFFYPESRGLKNVDVRQQATITMTGTAGAADNEIRADWIDIRFREQPGEVALDTLRAQDSARWTLLPRNQTDADRSSFSGMLDAGVIEMFYAKEGRFLDRIHSSGDVTMTEISADAKDASYSRKISADSVRVQFFPKKNEPKNMTAEGSVRVVYEGESTTAPGKPVAFNTASDVLEADFASGADGIVLASASQWGNFTYEDASMSATSGRCDYDAQKETMLLRDSPEIFFELGRTAGDTALFNLRERTLQIQNNVRSIVSGTNEPGLLGESSAGSSTIILADTMDHMVETSHTLYTGNVQLLSDEQQLQAEKLEILNGGEIVDAAGRIRHRIFRNRISADKRTRIGDSSVAASKDDGNAAGLPINIESSNFKYLKDIKTFTYSGEISLKSSDLQLKSGTLEAVLNDSGEDIQWARAENEVVFYKGKWECRGDVGYYFLEPERIEVEGDPAVCIDAEGMKPSAPRLTYNVADDRILLRERVD